MGISSKDADEFKLQGNKKFENGDYQGAIQDYTQAINLGSKNAEAYHQRAKSHHSLKNYEAAIKDYNEAIRLNPTESLYYSNRGEIIQLNPTESLYYSNRGLANCNLGNYQEAIQDYTQAINLDSKNAEAYHLRGNSRHNLKNYDDAIKDYNEAIRLNPTESVYYFDQGTANNGLGNYQEAIQDYTQAIRLDSKNADAYHKRGSSNYNLKNYEAAIKDYNEAIRLNPTESLYYFDRGSANYILGKHKEAIQDYTQAINLDSKNADAYHQRGRSNYNLKNYEAAIKDYNEAIRLNPSESLHYSNRGLANYNLVNYQKAIRDYTEIINLDSKNAKAYNKRGGCHHSLKDYEAAIKDYNEAIRLNPTESTYYSNRGDTNYYLENYAAAIKDYNEAIRLNLKNSDILHNLCYAHYELKDYKDAEIICNEALVIDPKDLYAHYNLGLVLNGLERFNEAIKSFTKALTFDPAHSYALSNRAFAYYSIGLLTTALEDANNSINLNKNDATAFHYRSLIHKKLNHQTAYEADLQAENNLKASSEISYNVNKPDEASNLDSEQEISTTPQDAKGFSKRGAAQYKLGNYHEALQDYNQAIKLDQQNSLSYFSRGLINYQLGQYNHAMADYSDSIKLNSKHGLSFKNRAWLNYLLKQYNLALNDINAAISLNESNTSLYYYRALIYKKIHQEDNYKKDIKTHEDLSEKSNTAAEHFFTEGKQLKTEGELTQAIQNFNDALQKNEFYFEAYFEKTQTLHEKGDLALATRTCYEAASKISENTDHNIKDKILPLYAKLLKENNKYIEAIEFCKETLILYPQLQNLKRELNIIFEHANLKPDVKQYHKRDLMLKKHKLLKNEPSYYECAIMCLEIYNKNIQGSTIKSFKNWEAIVFLNDPNHQGGYCSAVFKNEGLKTIVIAHRGTEFDDGRDLLSDAQLFLNIDNGQIQHALSFSKKIITLYEGYHIFHTGHSLGAALAEIAAFDNDHPCITFESPGVKEVIEAARGTHINFYAKSLTFLTAPNLVNTMGNHIGKAIHIFPTLPKFEKAKMGWLQNYFIEYAKGQIPKGFFKKGISNQEILDEIGIFTHYIIQQHSMQNILNLFNAQTEELHPETHMRKITSWPKGVDNFIKFYFSFVKEPKNIEDFHTKTLDDIQPQKKKFQLTNHLKYVTIDMPHEKHIKLETLPEEVKNDLIHYFKQQQNPHSLDVEILKEFELVGDDVVPKKDALIKVDELKMYLSRKFPQVIPNLDSEGQTIHANGPITQEISPTNVVYNRKTHMEAARESFSYRFFSGIAQGIEALKQTSRFLYQSATPENEKSNQESVPSAGVTYSGSLNEQLILLQWAGHYLSKWFTAEPLRELTTSEYLKLIEIKSYCKNTLHFSKKLNKKISHQLNAKNNSENNRWQPYVDYDYDQANSIKEQLNWIESSCSTLMIDITKIIKDNEISNHALAEVQKIHHKLQYKVDSCRENIKYLIKTTAVLKQPSETMPFNRNILWAYNVTVVPLGNENSIFHLKC